MRSSADPTDLASQQRWLLTAITQPHRVASPEVERHIASRGSVSAPARLAVYARGYLARLIACLEADYPALQALLGPALFSRFAADYVQARPPTGPSLFDFGAGFADYLDRSCPPDEAVPAARRPLMRLPADLARAERARLESLRAPGLEEAAPARASLPEAAWSLELMSGRQVCIGVPACMRIVETRVGIAGLLSALDRGEPPPSPDPAGQRLAFSRVAYRPTLTVITLWQQSLLQLCRTPQPLSRLVERLAGDLGRPAGAVWSDLALWAPAAQASGLLWVADACQSERPSTGC